MDPAKKDWHGWWFQKFGWRHCGQNGKTSFRIFITIGDGRLEVYGSSVVSGNLKKEDKKEVVGKVVSGAVILASITHRLKL